MTDAAYDEEERGLLALTSATPWDADLMLQLGRVQAGLLKYPEAADTLRRAIVLAPDDPRPWIEYALLSVHLHEGELATDTAFHRAAKLAGSDLAVLMGVIDYFSRDEKPKTALRYLEKVLSDHPSAIQIPRIQMRYLAG